MLLCSLSFVYFDNLALAKPSRTLAQSQSQSHLIDFRGYSVTQIALLCMASVDVYPLPHQGFFALASLHARACSNQPINMHTSGHARSSSCVSHKFREHTRVPQTRRARADWIGFDCAQSPSEHVSRRGNLRHDRQ